jgi:hypothetical protein
MKMNKAEIVVFIQKLINKLTFQPMSIRKARDPSNILNIKTIFIIFSTSHDSVNDSVICKL